MFNLSTGKEGTTLQPTTGISSFWATNFLFLSVVWWHLCPHSSLSTGTHWNIFNRASRCSIALSFARVFPAFHKARLSALFFAVICILSYLCCVFILTFECPSEDAPWYETVTSDCHKTGTTFLIRDVGTACELFFLRISVFDQIIISGSFCGWRFHIIPHNHFVESQTSTELASNHNFRLLWKRPNADHRNCV
jgi:hypothetical protein